MSKTQMEYEALVTKYEQATLRAEVSDAPEDWLAVAELEQHVAEMATRLEALG